ncbi:hypothetical protein D3C77_314530 [compost metagenome]
MVVGEGDEGFTTAAIVPPQIADRNAGSLGFVEDALEVLFVVLDIFLLFVPAEEVGGGQLLGVAHDDGLTRARNGPYGVPGRNLGGFVENHHIEQRLVRGEVLGNGQRRHQHTGGELAEMVRHPADHVANGLAGTLKLHLVTQQSEFRIAWNALDRG